MMRSTFRLLWIALMVAAFAAAGCGDDGGGNNSSSNNTNNGADAGNNDAGGGDGGNNLQCEHECSIIGAMRCDESVIEACTVDANGCKVWEAGVDCANSDKICDEQGDTAECVGGAGETCDDGAQNQDETDVDCGGSVCEPCSTGQQCEEASDCDTSNCDANNTDQCVDATTETCTDGTQNQDETDVDCGGATCAACEVDEGCTASSDCLSGYCDTNSGTCLADAPSCDDGVQNQDETDVDCGGSTCGACAEGQTCAQASDCSTGNCDSGNTDQCVAADAETCTDGVQNQDETDVDCGGSTCGACAIGATCSTHDDCATQVCDFIDTGTCIDATPSYEVDEDFETGDFSLFPYDFNSDQTSNPNHWEIETDPANCHAGSYCMRSSSVHGEGETTSVTLSLSVRQDTTISFWVKTNTEPGEHFFRFYIDGVQQIELSGQNAWQQVSFPVSATGPNGPNRVFEWEYSRSTYLDPNHVPWNEVWVDDIDMPAWNTEPTTPEQLAPWNGKLTTDRTPMFRWRSFDPDFDSIIYEMQYDTDPSFPDPKGTGETIDTQFTPPSDLDDQTVYYWRVRSKDDNNYRWSEWSPIWTVHVDSTYEYGAVWQQSTNDQFELNTLADAVVSNDSITPVQINYSGSDTGSSTSAVTLNYSNLPSVPTGTTGQIRISLDGDFNSSSEYATVSIEGTHIGTVNPSACSGSSTLSIPNLDQYVNDGQTTIRVNFSSYVDAGGCSGGSYTPYASGTLSYGANGTATVVTDTIDFGMFGGKQFWEKVQWVGSGDVSLRVLDAAGQPIPDTAIPGNSAGLTSKTVHLWDLDPAQYPAIKLEATLDGTATLEKWRVVGNDVFEWTFSHDTDTEGWEAKDHLATPTATVSGGIMRFESTATGDDPRIEYWFPQPIDASRFSTVEVRLRTSNNYNDDTVTFMWDSNYGAFDAWRSFTQGPIFLLQFQDLTFDLTVTPTSPQQPWQGQINAIRLDPVERFKDQAGNFADGWFEIERIAIY
ncbi:hypothetical protein FIV42_12755 [Persicimonas caeni]|uniref:Uncharacterized protein n=1 Tax=Persicimonas caeni TaxID=2292766 RepID=A0A4Y6PTB9_PERCE|nr:hypothetical protein [Persicimonas caeni]QDG51584.1 hypothetical protein FIV42_12755 [Persicimonas caeni]QED32805.1 hypothetical protein FRD00_12750 [Persicimonas caeni]